MKFLASNAEDRSELTDSENAFKATLDSYKEKYIAAMDDDLNTADAISVLFEIVSEANKTINATSGFSKKAINYAVDMLLELGNVLGLLQKKDDSTDSEVDAILEERAKARAEKNWAKSDELRDKLKEMGIIVKDTPQGQQITKA